MDHKRIIKHLPLMLAGIAMGLGVFINVNTSKHIEPVEAAIDYSACETAYNANNKSNLKTALYNVVKDGSAGDYDDLWTSYWTVYKRSDGYLKDYYSNTSNFTSDDRDRGSGGTTEGDKYNREHTIPKSWWGGSTSNQGADIFIVVPADKLVNNKRSDNCLGVVGSATYSSNNNYSKLGSSSASWNFFGSPVFEPNDEVKGDLARIVFYSVIKYNVASWTTGNGSYVYSGSTSASSNFGLTDNAVKLFSYWNNLDKPDEWERTVNTRGNSVQGNPNPFIDHPEYANTLWGDVSGYTTYSTSSTSLSVSPSSGSISVGGTLNLTASASGGSGSVSWSITSGSSYVSLNTTTGNSVTVTGDSEGTATVTASYSGTTASCSITVTSSSQGEATKYYQKCTSMSDISSGGKYVFVGYKEATTQYYAMPSYSSGNNIQGVTVTLTENNTRLTESNMSTAAVYTLTSTGTTNQYYIGDGSQYLYAAGSGTSNYLKAKATTDSSAGAFTISYSSYFSIVAASSNRNTMRFNTSNNPPIFSCYADNTSQTEVLIFKEIEEQSSQTVTLSSISVKTAPSKTTYTAGECFNPTGLVINRNYSDSTTDTYTYANHTSEFTFSPNTSTALTASNTSVTITYGGKSCIQAITVNKPAVTSISATVNKTYYVGETISSSDITVKDSNNDTVSSFTFANNGYKFTYSDASSGGALTDKTFTNAISGSNLTCSLTVQVQRKAHLSSSEVSDQLTASDFAATSTNYVSFSDVTKTSSAKYSGNSAKNNSSIQLRNNDGCGIWTTNSGGRVKSITVSWNSSTSNGRVLNVYASNSAYSTIDSSSATLVGTIVYGTSTSLVISGDYNFVGVRSNSGALYLNSITFTYGGEYPANVANYIMYEDTKNQCTSKLTTAIGYLHDLGESDRETFATSQDYVILTARERLEAWALNQRKSINYEDGSLNPLRVGVSIFENQNNNTAITVIIIISMLSISSVGLCLYMRKRKLDK